MITESVRQNERETTIQIRPFEMLLFCALPLAGWVLAFPVSGDGDAVTHFENFRTGAIDIKNILHPWARPAYAFVNIPASLLGLLPSRFFHLAISSVAFLQTYYHARELGLRNAVLVIPFCAFQPFVLVLSADTMTEMPFALVSIALLRLWHHRKYALFAALVGVSPLIRPEGFFFGAALGLLFLFQYPTGLALMERWATASLGMAGMLIWMGAGAIWASDWLYFYHTWPWGTTLQYGHGEWYHFVIYLPFIIGVVYLPLWVCGTIVAVRRRELWPSQVMWWLIFLVHSVLWAQGWMGSYGLLRIIACVAPPAAIVVLAGWNVMVSGLGLGVVSGRIMAAIMFLLAMNTALLQNVLMFENHFGRTSLALVPSFRKYVAEAPWFFVSEPTPIALSGLHCDDPRRLSPQKFGMDKHEFFRSLPKATVGFWDDHHGRFATGVSCEDLLEMGYEMLDESKLVVSPTYSGYPVKMRGIVVRKRE